MGNMNIVELWEQNKKMIYLSYIAIALIIFGVYVYVFYQWLSPTKDLWHYVIVFLLLSNIGMMIDGYKKERQGTYYPFPLLTLYVLGVTYGYVKNTLLIPSFFLLYLYVLFPLFVEYKVKEEIQEKRKCISKIIGFFALFFILLWFAGYYG